MDIIELHYYLPPNVHHMDAYVKNRAEAEVLRILKEISGLLDVEVDFQTEALATGGIREFIKIITKKKNRKRALLIITYIGAIFSGVIVNVVSDKLNEDPELKELEKKKLKLEIRKLEENDKVDVVPKNKDTVVKQVIYIISHNSKIITFKSNLYQTLKSESTIENFGVRVLSDNHEPLSDETIIQKVDFDSYIIPNEISKSETINGAFIEIVSPVLINGNYKWKGIYNGKQIGFNLLDADFRKSVVSGNISFTNGTIIKCDIVIDQSMNKDGEINITNIDVFGVDEVFQGSIRTETPRLKKKREAENQTRLNL